MTERRKHLYRCNHKAFHRGLASNQPPSELAIVCRDLASNAPTAGVASEWRELSRFYASQVS